MAKKTTVTYTCDLCERPTGEMSPVQIFLRHGAVFDVCADCVPAHQALLEKMRALIVAATPPPTQPGAAEQFWRLNQGAYGG